MDGLADKAFPSERNSKSTDSSKHKGLESLHMRSYITLQMQMRMLMAQLAIICCGPRQTKLAAFSL